MPAVRSARPLPPRVSGAPGPALDWSAHEPRGFYARRGHAALDLVLLALCLGPALALGLLIALVNWVAFRDPRKILYTQPRVGRRGRIFRIYKFRTMRDPRRDAHDSWAQGEDRVRVTRLGRFLRNAHLDELPQILNVLRGQMSFIGPRPEMIEIERWAAAEIPGFSLRLVLKPGITGPAQITQGYTGRNVEEYARKLAISRRYVEGLSLRTDLAILARTLLWMARGRGWKWNTGRGSAGAT